MDAAWSGRGIEGYAKVGRVLLLAWPLKSAAFGPGSLPTTRFSKGWARPPAITTDAAYINLDAEESSRSPPTPSSSSIRAASTHRRSPPASAAGLRETKFAALAALDIPAAKNHRMTIIDNPLGTIPSTAMVHLAEELQAQRYSSGWAAEK